MSAHAIGYDATTQLLPLRLHHHRAYSVRPLTKIVDLIAKTVESPTFRQAAFAPHPRLEGPSSEQSARSHHRRLSRQHV